MTDVRVIRADDLGEAAAPPGISVREAVSAEGFWAGLGVIEGGTFSGWHHHGEWETVACVRRGTLRFEFGPRGGEAVEVSTGDFVIVPRGTVHREGTATDEPVEVIVLRRGTGDLIFNLDGPEVGEAREEGT